MTGMASSVDRSATPLPAQREPVAAVRPHAAADGAATLRLEGLAHSFGGLDVLRQIDIDVPAGRLVGLIGPNGSGKTTCFNIACGFLRQKAGRVILDGTDISASSVQERSRAGLVRTFQAPKVFEQMTVLENLMVGAHKSTGTGVLAAMLGTRRARAELAATRADAQQCARRFGLENMLDTKAGLLPAGQRRIVELARACMGRPRALLLDEPSSGLNSEEIEVLRRWIVELNRDGLTVFLVSHDMGLMTVCDTVHVLYYGEIIACGSLADVQDDPRVREAYLGV